MMKKSLSLVVFALLGICTLTSSLWADLVAQVYRDDYNQFAIALPSNKWKWDSSIRTKHVKVKIVYHNSIDQFVPNLSVSISDLKKDEKDLKVLIKSSLESYPKQLKVKAQKEIKYQGQAAYDLKLLDENNLIEIQQRFFIHQKKVYVLTFAARQSSMERLLEDFHSMLNSFVLQKETGDTL